MIGVVEFMIPDRDTSYMDIQIIKRIKIDMNKEWFLLITENDDLIEVKTSSTHVNSIKINGDRVGSFKVRFDKVFKSISVNDTWANLHYQLLSQLEI